jgi:signal transduction histidine kinase
MKLPRVRLRTILLLINLVVLTLPLGGIFALRIYESALVRQTESELIAQSAFISATYQALLARQLQLVHRDTRNRNEAPPDDYGHPASFHPAADDDAARWRLRNAQLDLATDPILPPPPDPVAASESPDPFALAVGRELTPILRSAQLYTLSGIRVVDADGVIVASTGEDVGQSLRGHEEVARALRGEPVSLMRYRSGDALSVPLESISRGARIRVYVAAPILHNDRILGAVLLARTPANIKQAIYGKRAALLRAGLVLLVVVLALSLLTSLTISRPVQALNEQARRAARGERGAVTPLKHPGTQEIAELSETVAAMAGTLESRAAYIRDFAAHVSHEFKTPLTAIRGAVELLREHGKTMSDVERERFLGMLDTDRERLERLVKRLLELARADMVQPGNERAELGAAVQACAARYRELGLCIDVEDAAAGHYVAMSPDALDSILGTLLDNARQHAGAHAQVAIRCSIDRAAQRAAITVADDGPGISAGNAERIFEPFFTTARERGGTGLGLAIIRSLLAAHGGEIVRVDRAQGACFEVRIPLTGVMA